MSDVIVIIKKYLSICWNYICDFFRKIFRGQVVEKPPILPILEPKTENSIDSVAESKSGKAAVKPETEKMVESTVSPNVIFPVESTLYIGNDHWKLLLSFLSTATKSIRIITGSIAYDALSLILSHVQNGVSIKIATGRMKDYEQISKRIGVESIKSFKRLHAKLCIVDEKRMLIGSSNITSGSLGDNQGRYGSLEANIVVDDPSIVDSGKHLFNIIWNRKSDIDPLKIDNGFISSAYGIPFKIKELIQQAREEIVIIVPPLFGKFASGYKSIPKYIKDLNSDVKIKIITSHKINEYYEDAFNEIKAFDNTKIILAKNRIHAKIYVFDWKTAIISSVNLEYPQWVSSLESGIITTNNEILEIVKRKAYELESNIAPLEIVKNLEGEDESTHGESLEKMEFCFETEGKGIIPELRVDERIYDEKVKGKGIPIADNDTTSKETVKTSSKMDDELSPEKLGKINMQRCKLNRGRIKAQNVLNYLLICPYSNAEEIKAYIKILRSCGIHKEKIFLFKVFQLSFYEKNRIKIAGMSYKLLSILNNGFKDSFRNKTPNFFKNVILGEGKTGYPPLEVKNKEEYENFERDFRHSFEIEPPDRKEVLEKIYSQRSALKKMAINNIYCNRIRDIFKKDYPDKFKKLEEAIAMIKRTGGKLVVRKTNYSSKGTQKNLKKDMWLLNEHLCSAAKEGDFKTVKMLLSKGANVNAKDKNGWTSLMYAASKVNLLEIVNLLNKGANINAKDTLGWTALMYAVANGNVSVIKTLLDNGANNEFEEEFKKGVKNPEIVRLLKQVGAKE